MKSDKHLKVKSKYNEALKLYDNKEYKQAKRACEKILEKTPDHADTIALKGLILTNMNEKVEGEKLIKEALRKDIKNPTVWHFYAIYYKQEKNYSQSMKSYKCALMYDPTNTVILRDLTYLQLQLRQISAFSESAKKALELKSNIMVNWVTFSVAHYLTGNYSLAYKAIDSCKSMQETNLKEQEKNEIILYEALLLQKQKKYNEIITLLEANQKNVLDKTFYNENLFEAYLKTNNLEKAQEISLTLIERNPENVNYYFYYLRANNHNVNDFQTLLSVTDEKASSDILALLSGLRSKCKSKLLPRLELGISKNQDFKNFFISHLITNIRSSIPSIFFSIKFIYKYQAYKIPIIEEVLSDFLEKVEKKETYNNSNTNESLDLAFLPHMDFVHYYAAQHYDFLRNLEKALCFINKAIDQTPSYVEFYMIKSKIFKHAFMLNESGIAYDKAKKLDLGDRYLNAKSAKAYVRNDDTVKSVTTMKEFVRDPLSEDFADYIQCMWYEIETANAYLRQNKILPALRLYNLVVSHFNVFIEDQFDFHNYCLRRYIINDFIKYIEYMDRVIDHNFMFQALFGLQYILRYVQNHKDSVESEIAAQLKENENYNFKDIKAIQTEVENETHKLLRKLQPYTKMEYFQYLCVLDFIRVGKIIPALKSLIFLYKNNSNSYYFVDALTVFANYLHQNSTKISESYMNFITTEFPFLKNNQEAQKQIKSISDSYYASGENKVVLEFSKFKTSCSQGNKDFNSFKDSIAKIDQISLRRIPFSLFNEIVIYLNAHFTAENTNDFRTIFTGLTRINDEQKNIDANLHFYA